MAGYVLVSRDLFEDPAFASVRFPRPWAVIDLVQMARFKPGTEYVNGRYVSLERGQLCKSVRFLAQRWKWDEKTVSSFLKELANGGFISFKFPQSKGGLTNIISIVNYDSVLVDSHSDSHTNSHSDSGTDSHSDSHALYIGNKEEYNTSDTNVSSYSIQEIKKEEDTIAPIKKSPIDFSLVKKMWNDSMKRKVPKIQGISDARKEKIRLRIDEMGGWDKAQSTLIECFRKVNDSDFCNGEGGGDEHKWVATFDWFFTNDKNWMKVAEGNYDNRRQASRFEQSMGVAQRAKNLIGLIYGTSNTGTTDGFADSPDEQ